MAARVSSPAAPDKGIDIETIRSRLKELAEGARAGLLDHVEASSNPKDLMEDCLAELLNARHEIELDDKSVASLATEDSEAFLEQLKRELKNVEDEKRKIENEITSLIRTIHDDSAQVYSDFGALDCSLKLSSSVDVHKSQGTMLNCESVCRDLEVGTTYACEDEKFKMLQLDHQIEEANRHLTCLKKLDSVFKRDEAIGLVEDMLSEEVKPTEFDGNCIRLSIRTPISILDGSVLGQKMDFVIDPLVFHHELTIEVIDEPMELKNIEIQRFECIHLPFTTGKKEMLEEVRLRQSAEQIFPNDVCLDNIITAAKASRLLFSLCSAPLVQSSLEWLVRKVKQQIFLCNIRCLMVKDANNVRHSFEYLDKDGTIIAHLVRGIDAVIKVSHGWPISPSALHLVSIKSSDVHLKGLSIGFFYKIKELANSLDAHIRCHLSRFADAIEEIFAREMLQKI